MSERNAHLLQELEHLHAEVQSMRLKMREMANTRPESKKHWRSKSREVVDDVNQLVRRYERAASRSRERDTQRPDFFEKLCMFMLSELA